MAAKPLVVILMSCCEGWELRGLGRGVKARCEGVEESEGGAEVLIL